MTIDWTSVLIQLANFALLVVLLRIFLYRPVLKVMDERAELTAAPLREARRLAEEAEQDRAAMKLERASLEQERVELLTAERLELEHLRGRRLEELEHEVRAKRAAAFESVERSLERATGRLHSGVANIVVDEVRHTLADLSGADLDAQAWLRFAERLPTLPAEQRAEFAHAARVHGVRVVTPRPLPSEVAEAARTTLTELLGGEAGSASDAVTFAIDPDLLLGVALEAGGLRLDGTASARLEALETTLVDAVRNEKS